MLKQFTGLMAGLVAAVSAETLTANQVGTYYAEIQNAALSFSPYNHSDAVVCYYGRCDQYALVDHVLTATRIGDQNTIWSDTPAGVTYLDTAGFKPVAWVDSSTAVNCQAAKYGKLACFAMDITTGTSTNTVVYELDRGTYKAWTRHWMGASGPQHVVACGETDYGTKCVLLKLSADKQTLSIVDSMNPSGLGTAVEGAVMGNDDTDILLFHQYYYMGVTLLKRVGDTLVEVTNTMYMGPDGTRVPSTDYTKQSGIRLSETTAMECWGGRAHNGCIKITVDNDTLSFTDPVEFVPAGVNIRDDWLPKYVMASTGDSSAFMLLARPNDATNVGETLWFTKISWDVHGVATLEHTSMSQFNIHYGSGPHLLFRADDTLIMQTTTRKVFEIGGSWSGLSSTLKLVEGPVDVAAGPETWTMSVVGTDVYKCHPDRGCYVNSAGNRRKWEIIADPGNVNSTAVGFSADTGDGSWAVIDSVLQFQTHTSRKKIMSWLFACRLTCPYVYT